MSAKEPVDLTDEGLRKLVADEMWDMLAPHGAERYSVAESLTHGWRLW